jgi:hypothetical protein
MLDPCTGKAKPRISATWSTGKNRIMIFGPKTDGTYIIEFKTAAGDLMVGKGRFHQTRPTVAGSLMGAAARWCTGDGSCDHWKSTRRSKNAKRSLGCEADQALANLRDVIIIARVALERQGFRRPATALPHGDYHGRTGRPHDHAQGAPLRLKTSRNKQKRLFKVGSTAASPSRKRSLGRVRERDRAAE